jgi:hypothetical protein
MPGPLGAPMLQLIAEVVSFLMLEYLIRGPGYLICRLFVKKSDLSIEHGKVLMIGFAFWVCLIAAIYAGYTYLTKVGA